MAAPRLVPQVPRRGQSFAPVVRSQAKQRHDEILGGHGERESAPRVVSFDEDTRVDPAAGVRGCRQQWCSTALGDPPGIRANPERGEAEQAVAPAHEAGTINLPGQPAQSDPLERNERMSRKLPGAIKPVPDSRGQGCGTLLEVGGTLIAKARDRIDAAVEVLRGLRVFDQSRAEIDEGIQVVDLLEPALGVQPGNLGAVKVERGQVQTTVVEGLERTRNTGQLGEPGIQRRCSLLELRQLFFSRSSPRWFLSGLIAP